MTNKKIAESLGISEAQLYKYFARAATPGPSTRLRIEQVFNLPPGGALLWLEDEICKRRGGRNEG